MAQAPKESTPLVKSDVAERGVQLSVRGPCNLRCLFCNLFHSLPEIDEAEHFDEMCDEIDRVVATGTCDVSWGVYHYEPTTYPRLLELISRARQRGIIYHRLTTNGIMTADLAYLRELKSVGVTAINLSLYEWDEESADLICQAKGVLAKKLATLENCKRLGIQANSQIILMRANYHRVAEIAGLYRHFFPQNLALVPIFPGMGPRTSWFLPPLSGVYAAVAEVAKSPDGPSLNLFDIPACIQQRLQAPERLTLDSNAEHSFVEKCNDCRMKKSCCGVRPEYLEIYGDGEITRGEVIDEPIDLDELLGLCNGAILQQQLETNRLQGEPEEMTGQQLAAELSHILLPDGSPRSLGGFRVIDVAPIHDDLVQVTLHRGAHDIRLLVTLRLTTQQAYVHAGRLAILLSNNGPPLYQGPKRVALLLAQEFREHFPD